LPDREGLNQALTVLYAPDSLNSGQLETTPAPSRADTPGPANADNHPLFPNPESHFEILTTYKLTSRNLLHRTIFISDIRVNV